MHEPDSAPQDRVARAMLKFGPVGGALAFVALTGLIVWTWPFGAFAQCALLLHATVGTLLIVPLAPWLLGHWLATRNAPRTRGKLCAYAGLWVLASTTVAGVALTWQGMFSLRIGRVWDQVHLWTGLMVLPLVAYHVWSGATRSAVPVAEYSPLQRRMRRTAAGTALVLFALLGAMTFGYRSRNERSYQLASGYEWSYGKNPFAPSLATTADGKPVSPRVLASSQSCGASGCHTAIYREWRASAHRWAAEDKFFQAVQTSMIKEEGAPATRYCGGCHDPVSLLAGYKDASSGISAPGFKEGDSCVICHAMRRVDVQGNGNYVFGAPSAYLFEYDNGRYRTAVTRFLIRAYPWQHDRDFDLTLARRPESCASCHKQFIDREINHVGWVQLQNQYDDWSHGKWNADADPARRLRCQQCHMYYEKAPDRSQADPYDLAVGLGTAHRVHHFAAGNQVMPVMLSSPDAGEQTRRVEEWLRGARTIPEISHVWPKGPVFPVKIAAPAEARPGESLAFRVVISNNKAGHSFPTGPLDLIRAWVEVIARDQDGRTLFHSGQLTADNHVEPGTFVLKAMGVNAEGQEIVRHDLWHYVGATFKRAIFPGYSDMYEYRFAVPATVKGPLEVTARLRYRKANQYFMDWAFPGQHLQAPITDISDDRAEISIGRASPRDGAGR